MKNPDKGGGSKWKISVIFQVRLWESIPWRVKYLNMRSVDNCIWDIQYEICGYEDKKKYYKNTK